MRKLIVQQWVTRTRGVREAAQFAEPFADHRIRDPLYYELRKPSRQAENSQATADEAQAEAARLRALPVIEAADQITAKQAASDAEQRAKAERARRLRTPDQFTTTRRDPRRDGPERGL